MTLGNTLQWNFNQNTKLFIHKNACENILCEIAVILSRGRQVDWLSPSDTYIHQLIGSTLANVMFCCLFGVKPLPEQMMTHCKLDSQQINFSKISIKIFFLSPTSNAFIHPGVKEQSTQCEGLLFWPILQTHLSTWGTGRLGEAENITMTSYEW